MADRRSALDMGMRATLLIGAALAAVASSLPGPALAQAYPSKPITLMLSSAPGGGVDFYARVLAERLRPNLGQPVIVEHRPGASGMIAAGLAAKAAPDGYTVMLMPNTIVFAPYVLPPGATTVSVVKELAPVVMPVSTPMLLAVHGSLKIRSVPDLITHARSHPGLHYTGGPNASPMHILGEQFRSSFRLDMVHVAYKGTAQALTAALANEIPVIWMTTSTGSVQHLRSGALTPLAVVSSKRSALLPDVPTMVELGHKDMDGTAWFGIVAPLATPAATIARFNRAVNEVQSDPGMRQKLEASGFNLEGGGPEVLGARMRKDDEYYRRVIREFGIKSD